jgi:hypothetical protein
MGPTLTIRADPRAISMAAAIGGLVDSAPVFVGGGRAFADLARELGSYGAAAEFLRELVERHDKPIALNVPTGPDTSRTIFIAPGSWPGEKLRGWAAGAAVSGLADPFGPVERISTPRGPRFHPRKRRRGKGRRCWPPGCPRCRPAAGRRRR